MHEQDSPTRKNSEPPVHNKIINADCLKVLQKIPADSLGLTLFSPPYDGIRNYRGNWQVDFPALGRELFRAGKNGGICAVVIGDGTKNHAKTMSTFSLAVDWCQNAGWRLFECCLYHHDGNPSVWWNNRFHCISRANVRFN